MVTVNKSYNPFKMWGSWAGVIIGLLPIIIGSILQLDDMARVLNFFLTKLNPFYYLEISICKEPGCGILTIISTPIIFFIYGWAIHLIIRKLKN